MKNRGSGGVTRLASYFSGIERLPDSGRNRRSVFTSFIGKGKAPWREYIDIEHSTAYWADNYWCAFTDGKIKYIWFFRTGEEQLFDLSKDPYELHDLSKAKASGKTLEKMRKAMAGHLQERGEEWVKDGKLVIRNKNLLYSPNYPTNKNKP